MLNNRNANRKKWAFPNLINTIFRVTFLIFCTGLSAFPLVWMFLTSIKYRVDAFAIPPVFIFTPTIEAYEQIIAEQRFLNMLQNSINVTLLSTFITIIAAAMAAYAVTFLPIRGKNVFLISVLATRLLPPVVLVVPLYFIVRWIGLYDTIPAMALVTAAINTPFAVILFLGFLRDIPINLVESAMLDGANHLKILARIVLPLAAPGFVVVAILVAIFTWNDFIFALILTSKKAATLPLFAAGLITDEGVFWSKLSAAGTMMLLPLIVFFFSLQRKLDAGLLTGATKG